MQPATTMSKLLAGYLLMVIVIMIYYPVSYLFFSAPDDPWMLLKNELVRPADFDLTWLYNVFRAPGDIQYSPVNTLYYYLIYQINGYDPYYFHLFSFLLHVANIGLVYVLVNELLNSFAIDRAQTVAYVVTFLWAVHPFNVEVVAWIAASKVLLFSFFAMLSFIWFLRRRLMLSMLAFALACLCKEQALVTPFLYVCYLLCRMEPISKRMWLWLTGCFLISASVLLIFLRLNDHTFPVPVAEYTIWERFFLSFYCLRFYITGLLIPVNLHFHYGYPFSTGGSIPPILYVYPLIFLAFAYYIGLLLKRARHKWFFIFCIAFFLVHIGLVLQLVPMTRNTITADRYMYLPSLPLLMIVVHLCVNQWKGNLKNYLAALYIIVFAVYASYLADTWTNFNLIPHDAK